MKRLKLLTAVLFVIGCSAAPLPAPPPPECPPAAPPAVPAPATAAPAAAVAQPEADVPAPLLAAAPDPQPPLFGKLGDLPLASGETIKDCQVEYRTLGTLNADKSNVVVWATWFSGIT